jgi:hypothetical protein
LRVKLSNFGLCKPVRFVIIFVSHGVLHDGSAVTAVQWPQRASHTTARSLTQTHARTTRAPRAPPPLLQVDVSSLPTLREGEEFTDANGRPPEATASTRPQVC